MKKYPDLSDELAANPKIEKFLEWYEMSGFLPAEELLSKAQKDFGIGVDEVAELIKKELIALKRPKDGEIVAGFYIEKDIDAGAALDEPLLNVEGDQGGCNISEKDEDSISELLTVDLKFSPAPDWKSIFVENLAKTGGKDAIFSALQKWIRDGDDEGRYMADIIHNGVALGLKIEDILNSNFLSILRRTENRTWALDVTDEDIAHFIEIYKAKAFLAQGQPPSFAAIEEKFMEKDIHVRIQVKQALRSELDEEERAYLSKFKKPN